MNRNECLDKAKEIINKDRQNLYGEPEQNFGYIADYWTTYLHSRGIRGKILPHDVAVMMNLMKVARIASSPEHCDNWVDICGYIANGAECVAKEIVIGAIKDSKATEPSQELKSFNAYVDLGGCKCQNQ